VCNHLPGETTCLGDRDNRYGSKSANCGLDGVTLQGVARKFVIRVGEISARIVTDPDMQVRCLALKAVESVEEEISERHAVNVTS
jgi:hypothetical protein